MLYTHLKQFFAANINALFIKKNYLRKTPVLLVIMDRIDDFSDKTVVSRQHMYCHLPE